jgi:hypothetical protein
MLMSTLTASWGKKRSFRVRRMCSSMGDCKCLPRRRLQLGSLGPERASPAGGGAAGGGRGAFGSVCPGVNPVEVPMGSFVQLPMFCSSALFLFQVRTLVGQALPPQCTSQPVTTRGQVQMMGCACCAATCCLCKQKRSRSECFRFRHQAVLKFGPPCLGKARGGKASSPLGHKCFCHFFVYSHGASARIEFMASGLPR